MARDRLTQRVDRGKHGNANVYTTGNGPHYRDTDAASLVLIRLMEL